MHAASPLSKEQAGRISYQSVEDRPRRDRTRKRAVVQPIEIVAQRD